VKQRPAREGGWDVSLLVFDFGSAAGFGGWIVGSLYPAPPAGLEKVHAQAIVDRGG
jgi:hypothetical protein